MNRRQEPCRNFARGSCKYGAQCKFLHVPQQQARPKAFGFGTQNTSPFTQPTQQQKPNPFGFGTQNTSPFAQPIQQQKPNPFGFGVQPASSPSTNADFGARYQAPLKPFENKWTRTSSSMPSKPTETQSQAALHTNCTDPQSCKQEIAEDFKNEAPLWKLTCYGHRKGGPCDIVGDISFEELRATAYDGARQGQSLQSVVERERNLLNAKLIEFDNLLRNPYVPKNPSFPTMGLSPEPKSIAPFGGSQTNAPPVFTSFSQLGPAANTGSGFSFGQPAAVTNAGSGFRATTPTMPTANAFAQSSSLQNTNQTPGGVAMNFGVSGAFGNSMPNQQPGSVPTSSTSNFTFGPRVGGNDHHFPPHTQFGNVNKQSSDLLDGFALSSTMLDQTTAEEKKDESTNNDIWLKTRWSVGEIPEEEPPQKYC